MISLDEQIDYVRRLLEQNQPNPVFTLVNQSILATLQSIKGAGDDVVEPELWGVERDLVSIKDYDTLLSAYKQVCVEREQFRKDAERYRYWRDNHGWTGYFDDGETNGDDPNAIDEAIDSARNK